MFDRQPRSTPLISRILQGAALILLVTLVVLALFAVFNPQEPKDHLDQARLALEANKPREAIRLLDRAEGAMQGDSPLLAVLLRIRAGAHLQVGHLHFAERDLKTLHDLLADPDEKARIRIEIATTITLGKAERANREERYDEALTEVEAAFAAVRKLTNHADPELRLTALESAGRSSQRAYQMILAGIQRTLSVTLPGQTMLRVNRIMLDLVFRYRKDLVYRNRRLELVRELTASPLSNEGRDRVLADLNRAREWIDRSFVQYGTALGPEGAIAAFQGVTGLLLQAGYPDRVAMLCHLALHGEESPYLGRAVHRLATLYQDRGCPDQAYTVMRKWLTDNPPQSQVETWGTLPAPTQDVLVRLLDLALVRGLAPLFATPPGEPDRDFIHCIQLAWPVWKQLGGRLKTYWPLYQGFADFLNRKDPVKLLRQFSRSHAGLSAEWIDRFVLAQLTLYAHYRRTGDRAAAAKVLRRLVEARPEDIQVLHFRADLFTRENRLQEALQVLEKAYDLGQDQDTLNRIWEVKEKQLAAAGRSAGLEGPRLVKRGNLYTRSLADPHLHLTLARWFRAHKLTSAALYHAQEAARIYPGSPTVALLLAEVRLQTGRLEEARSGLESLRQGKAERARVLTLLHKVYQAQGHRDPTLNRELVLHADTPASHRLVVEGLLDQGRYDQALQVATRAGRRFGGQHPWFPLACGDCCRELGRYGQALQWYSAVPAAAPETWAARRGTTVAAARTGATQALDGALAALMKPDADPETVRHTAVDLAGLGRYAAAARLLTSLAARPDLEGKGALYVDLARMHNGADQPDKAIEAAEAAMAFKDGTGAVPFLVLAYLAQDDPRNAADVLGHVRPAPFDPFDRATVRALVGGGEGTPSKALPPGDELVGKARRRALDLLTGRPNAAAASTGHPDLDRLVTRHPKELALALLLADQKGFEITAWKLLRRLNHNRRPPERSWLHHLQALARFKAGHIREGLGELSLALDSAPTNEPALNLLCDRALAFTDRQPPAVRYALLVQSFYPLWSRTLATPEGGIRPLVARDWRFLSAYTRALSDMADQLGTTVAAQDPGARENPLLQVARAMRGQADMLLSRGERPPSRELIQQAIAKQEYRKACRLLAFAFFSARGEERARLGESHFRLVKRVPALHAEARQLAQRLVDAPGGPFGPALHFLIGTEPGVRQAVVTRYRTALGKHLAKAIAAPTTAVEFAWGGASARQLVPVDPEAARDGARRLLERNPAAWSAWEALGLALEALAEPAAARRVLACPGRYLSPSPLAATRTLFLTRANLIGHGPVTGLPVGLHSAGEPEPVWPTDRDLAALGGDSATPAGRLALALVQIRRHEYKAGLATLDQLPVQGPEALFYGTLAALALGPDHYARARANLKKLCTVHATTPFGEHLPLVLKMLGN